jgi:hypothetical protein
MKGQFTDQYSEILKLKFVSCLDFRNYQTLLSQVSSYGLWVIKIIQTVLWVSSSENLASHYLLRRVLSSISDLFQHLITSDLSTTLLEATKLYNLY